MKSGPILDQALDFTDLPREIPAEPISRGEHRENHLNTDSILIDTVFGATEGTDAVLPSAMSSSKMEQGRTDRI